MGDCAEFVVGPTGVRKTAGSFWGIRDDGLKKILEGARRFLLDDGFLYRDWHVRVHTHDFPTKKRHGGPLEFQTVSDAGGAELFPDWVFGGWWHMGMSEWDPFVRELADAGRAPPSDDRAYWKGAHLGVQQRAVYSELCASSPERFAGGFMNWGPNGKHNNFTPMKDQCGHAVLVDLAGVGYSGRLKMLAFTGRPMIVADRRWWSWADSEIMSRCLHFGAREDLSDLKDVYDGIIGGLEFARRRAEDLRDFCLREMTFERACRQAAKVISEEIGKK